jgi:chromate transporter
MSEAQPEQSVPNPDAGTAITPADGKAPQLHQIFLAFLRLGSVSFGGPAMVAYIKQLAVGRKKWLSKDEFQQGVALCQAVPGATAMQCAAYVGLRTRGLGGAVAAYLGFGLPAFVLMLSLSVAYQHAVQLHAVTSMLAGLRAIVVALVANSAWTFARSSVKRLREGAISLATAVLFLLGANPFLIVVAAGVAGAFFLRGPVQAQQEGPAPQLAGWRALRSPAVVAAFGIAIIAALFLLDRKLMTLGLVMMKVDAFAFGGGFASVPLMFREVVGARSWVPANVFMDGIALGQVTPGPIVITATFVGHQVAGLAGAVVGTVCIFLPSLFVLVLAAPWFERFRSSARFRGASQALVLSFVGLLVSVTIQFARLTPWSVSSAIIASLALLALVRKVDVLWVVLAGATVSALVL